MTQVIYQNPDTCTIEEGTLKGVKDCPFLHRAGEVCPACNNTGKSAYIVGVGGVYAPVQDVLAVVRRGKEQRGDLVFYKGAVIGNIWERTRTGLMFWDMRVGSFKIIRNRSAVIIALPITEAIKEIGVQA